MLRVLLLLMLASVVFSCIEDDSCSQNTVTGVNVTVSNSGADASSDDDGLDYNNIESWRFTALDDTTALVSSDNLSYSPGIPLDMNDTTITLLFKIRDNDTTDYLRDTVVFNYYQTDLQLLSINCGFAPLFYLKGGNSTLNILDSVILYESSITTDMQINNVAFYY